MHWIGLVTVVAVALGFSYTNGFHDSANAIATSVSTRALTPRAALLMAAVMNLLGSYIGLRLGGGVASTITKGIIKTPPGDAGLWIVFSLLVGAIVWNVATWYYGLPSSSSHALIGGIDRRRPGRRHHGGVEGRLGQGRPADGDVPDRRVHPGVLPDGRDPVDVPARASGPGDARASGSRRPSRPRRWRWATASRTRRRRSA